MPVPFVGRKNGVSFQDQVKYVFFATCDLDATSQRSRVLELCSDNAELLREVERLLDNDVDHENYEADTQAVADEWIGESLGNYRLLRRIGEGGMGVVYLGEDIRLKRRIAVKLLAPRMLRDKEFRDRFLREAQAAAVLDHPSICTVYDIGDANGQPYIVSAYLEGRTLEDVMQLRCLSAKSAIDYAIQLAEGLQAAHAKRIIHRDLKPSNVILAEGADGTTHATIIDFGLADVRSNDRLTEPGQLFGTATYICPECLKGDPVEEQSDIWSLGVMVYEMLAGRPPFDAANRERLFFLISHENPAPVSDVTPDLPPDADRVIAKALQKDTALRYSDIGSFLEDLRGLKDQLESPGEKSVPRIKDQRSRTAALPFRSKLRTPAMVILALCAMIVIAVLVRSRENDNAVNLTPSIVVMPIAASDNDTQTRAMAEAVTGSLIVNLSKITGFRVISRRSAESLNSQKLTPREIASRMPVDYVVEGSLVRSGTRSRLSVQMVRTVDDTNLWAEDFDFEYAWQDVLKVQQKAAERIVRQIRMYLNPADLAAMRRSTNTNVAAYEEYAKGRYSLIKLKNTLLPENSTEAEQFLKRAAALDPSFVLPHVELADLYLHLIYPPRSNREELLKWSRTSLDRALVLDPQNAAAHYLSGFWHLLNGEPRKALELCRRGVELMPSDSEAYYYLAMVYGAMGFYESALATQEEAIRRDSFNLVLYSQRVRYLVALGRLEEAMKVLDVQRDVEPSSVRYLIGLAPIQLHRGLLDEFVKTWNALETTRTTDPGTARTLAEAARALASALRGDSGPGHRFLKDPGRLRHRQTDYLMLLPAVIGDAQLTKSLVRGNTEYSNYRWLITDRVMAKVVHTPTYRDLLAELYEKWERDVRELGPSLPVMPPKLPTP
jgi:serine/threonine protein kinase/tetratricopeptide (TPR) repeat protein